MGKEILRVSTSMCIYYHFIPIYFQNEWETPFSKVIYNLVYPRHGILVSNKKWQNDIDSKMDETQNMLNERRHTGPCII